LISSNETATKKTEDKPSEQSQTKKDKPVVLELTPEKTDKKESDGPSEDGGVQRGNAPKEEFSGPPDQIEKQDASSSNKTNDSIKTIIMPVIKAPQAQSAPES
jgi:hypothetical protein